MESENCDLAVSELDRMISEEYSIACPIITKTKTYKDWEKPRITGYFKSLIRKRQNYFYLFKHDTIAWDQLKTF